MQENLGKKYSFRELLQDNDFSISIPLIQRDYVQGKENKSEVRKEFLSTLKKYLINGENKDLDFVYGYVEDNKFIPLDGQQRLTTLFLLHTYLAQISGNTEKWKEVLNLEKDFKFKYETRRSSAEFCKDFILYGIDFHLYENVKKDFKSFADFVNNLHWFKSSWNLDPTIFSMINMLLAIHNLFKDDAALYEKLLSKENPVLTFLFLDLKDLNQGDELYIKMNARGKMLTPFENFKARFEEKVGALFKENDKERILIYNFKDIKLSTKDYVSFKLDSVWSNLFWVYRDLVGNPNNYDDEIFNFIKEILLYYRIKQLSTGNELLDVDFDSSLETYNQLNEKKLLTRESVEYLISVLDSLQYDKNGIAIFVENKYFNESEIFKLVLSRNIKNPNRVKFYAYIEFLLNKNFEKPKLQSWMRVVCNLVDNKILNSQEMIIPAFKSIDELIKNADNIEYHLTSNPKISFFENSQILEEKIKAKIFIEKPESRDTIIVLEQNVFHEGQIGYLLEVSGIIDNVDISSQEFLKKVNIDQQLENLYSLGENAIRLFDYLNKNVDHIFERGILTYGNYLVKKSDQQYNFSSSKSVANYDRDYSWKSILALDFIKLKSENTLPRREIFYQILNDKSFDFSHVEKSLLNRIKNFTDQNDWRFDFIKQPEYIKKCKQGFIYTHSKRFDDIQLLNASQLNHLRMDLAVLKFWIESNLNSLTKFNKRLISVQRTDEVPYISIDNIVRNRKHYALQFYRMEGSDFYIRFCKTKGYNNETDYDDEVKDILKEYKFIWNGKLFHQGFTVRSKNFYEITKTYIDLLLKIEKK